MVLLTWSGLRGGISVALVLSLPSSEFRSLILTCCYTVVIFTMIVQGLTLRPLAARLYGDRAPGASRTGDHAAESVAAPPSGG